MPSVDRAAEIAEAIGWELYLGPKRDVAPPPGPQADGGGVPDNFALIRRVEVSASAGGGLVALDGPEGQPIAFRRDWLLKRGVRPDEAFIIQARGESMEPTISDGDLILVDTTRTDLPHRDPKDLRHLRRIHVLRIDGELFVKRLDYRPDQRVLILVSDNLSYGNDTAIGDEVADVAVIGEAIWWGHSARR